jgi:diguanylate cyclase (GGDEF)-like protein
MIAANGNLKVFFGIMWILLFVSFVFMYVDFSSYASLKREYRELELTIFSDPVTGMANRSSCDAFIEQYLDKPLPDDIGCIIFDITNLSDINQRFGYKEGNAAICEFSAILQAAAMDVCFVGRNSGNKFIAIFQACTRPKMEDFLHYVKSHVAMSNLKAEKSKICFEYGLAFQEEDQVANINRLIALANRRAIEAYRPFVDREVPE